MTTTASDTTEAQWLADDKMFSTILPDAVNQIFRKDFNSIIVDVRETKDFIKGHVPGAINLPKGNWGRISGLKYDLTMIIYSYSRMSSLAVQAILEFARHGYSVMEMEGGFEAWKENNLPVEA